MNVLIKDLYEKSKKENIKAVDNKRLKEMGFNDSQIQEIINEFLKNQPKKIWKIGECPRCGSSVDSRPPNFDSRTFTCDCQFEFNGSNAKNTRTFIRLN